MLHRDTVDRVLVRSMEASPLRVKVHSLRHREWDVGGNCERPQLVTLYARRETRKHKYIVVRTPTDGPSWAELWTRCRKCTKCLQARSRLWRDRMQHELKQSPRSWFVTLTVRPEVRQRMRDTIRVRAGLQGCDADALDASEQFGQLCSELGKELSKYLKRVRKECEGTFRYSLVYEPHKDGFPHVHALIHELPGGRAVRLKTLKYQWKLGWSKPELVRDPNKCGAYVAKYLTKDGTARVRASLHYGTIRVQSVPRAPEGSTETLPPQFANSAAGAMLRLDGAPNMGANSNAELSHRLESERKIGAGVGWHSKPEARIQAKSGEPAGSCAPSKAAAEASAPITAAIRNPGDKQDGTRRMEQSHARTCEEGGTDSRTALPPVVIPARFATLRAIPEPVHTGMGPVGPVEPVQPAQKSTELDGSRVDSARRLREGAERRGTDRPRHPVRLPVGQELAQLQLRVALNHVQLPADASRLDNGIPQQKSSGRASSRSTPGAHLDPLGQGHLVCDAEGRRGAGPAATEGVAVRISMAGPRDSIPAATAAGRGADSAAVASRSARAWRATLATARPVPGWDPDPWGEPEPWGAGRFSEPWPDPYDRAGASQRAPAAPATSDNVAPSAASHYGPQDTPEPWWASEWRRVAEPINRQCARNISELKPWVVAATSIKAQARKARETRERSKAKGSRAPSFYH